jgi:nucleoside-diphosphate-sugar epimerase
MINLSGTERLLAQLSPGQLLVYASTTSIYGRKGDVCTETSEVAPGSLYASTKYEAEKRCMERENSVSLRFATIFGVAPRMRRDLLPNDFVMRAVQERALILFDAASIRTFLHIDDAVRAYELALDRADAMAGDVFNVGSEQLNLSKRQIAEKIAEHVEFDIIDSTLADPDARHFVVNFDKIAKLGFRPERTLDEGIRELVRLFRFYRPTLPYKTI